MNLLLLFFAYRSSSSSSSSLADKEKGCRKQPAILQELELAQRTNHDDASSISCCKPLELQN
jgi:hypothetical protein